MPEPLRLATRGSALALAQARIVADGLLAAWPGLEVTLVRVETEGDRRRDLATTRLGGKGVFTAAVQQAVLDGRADLAVHSAKDLPAGQTPGLALAAVPRREDPRDVLVTAGGRGSGGLKSEAPTHRAGARLEPSGSPPVDEGELGAARSPASDRAVAVGLERTGRVVTAAAALMVVVFLGFAVGELLPLKAMGVGMIVAIVLDATVVRLLLVPAVMTLLGRWNWWAPPPLRRLHARFARPRAAAAAPAGLLGATRKST
jgi:hypothetical protein